MSDKRALTNQPEQPEPTTNGRKVTEPKRSGYFNIQFSEEFHAKIDAIKARKNFRTKQDTITRLVEIGLLVAKAQEDGMSIVIEDSEGGRMRVWLI